jgi:hypothetical protein
MRVLTDQENRTNNTGGPLARQYLLKPADLNLSVHQARK